VKGRLIGWRRTLLQRHRLLVFDDRLEEVTDALLGLEVRRLFFDEAESLTVHRALGALIGTGALAVVFTLLLLGVALAGADRSVIVVIAIILAVIALALVLLLVFPQHVVKVRAPDQVFEAQLPALRFRRERAVRLLVEKIERYQREHAPPPDDRSSLG